MCPKCLIGKLVMMLKSKKEKLIGWGCNHCGYWEPL